MAAAGDGGCIGLIDMKDLLAQEDEAARLELGKRLWVLEFSFSDGAAPPFPECLLCESPQWAQYGIWGRDTDRSATVLLKLWAKALAAAQAPAARPGPPAAQSESAAATALDSAVAAPVPTASAADLPTTERKALVRQVADAVAARLEKSRYDKNEELVFQGKRLEHWTCKEVRRPTGQPPHGLNLNRSSCAERRGGQRHWPRQCPFADCDTLCAGRPAVRTDRRRSHCLLSPRGDRSVHAARLPSGSAELTQQPQVPAGARVSFSASRRGRGDSSEASCFRCGTQSNKRVYPSASVISAESDEEKRETLEAARQQKVRVRRRL